MEENRNEKTVVVEKDKSSSAGVVFAIIAIVVLIVLALMAYNMFGNAGGTETNIEATVPAPSSTPAPTE